MKLSLMKQFVKALLTEQDCFLSNHFGISWIINKKIKNKKDEHFMSTMLEIKTNG